MTGRGLRVSAAVAALCWAGQSLAADPPPLPPPEVGTSLRPPNVRPVSASTDAPVSIPAGPEGLGPVLPPPLPAEAYLGREHNLTPQQRVGLVISKEFLAGSASGLTPRPVVGEQGSVVFAFGASEPNVVCAVLQVCDVLMEPGEHINSIAIGDSARWLVSPAVSGTAPRETQHIIIKPLDVGLSTSLVIATDARTYHIALTSRRSDYMPVVAFTYPADTAAQWEALRARSAAQQAAIQRETALVTPGPIGQTEYLADLHFNYLIRGSARWKPARVYNDGTRTIIEMPRSIAQADAPSLVVVRRGGTPKKADDTTLVNYRVQDARYIVDEVFDEAVLISGVGKRQERVTIIRGK